MNYKSNLGFLVLAGSMIIALTLLSCTPSVEPSKETADDTSLSPPVSLPAASTIAGEAVAKESRLRSIPAARIGAARTGLHVAYQHTSHGTHVSYGLFGLPSFETGDDILFAITNNASTPVAGKLDFKDYAIAPNEYCDLSTSDNGGWPSWLSRNRVYLDDPANSAINVVMWS